MNILANYLLSSPSRFDKSRAPILAAIVAVAIENDLRCCDSLILFLSTSLLKELRRTSSLEVEVTYTYLEHRQLARTARWSERLSVKLVRW